MEWRAGRGWAVTALYVVVVLGISMLVMVAAARAEPEEGLGEGEPAKVYEPPEEVPPEPGPPPGQHECPEDPPAEGSEVEYSVEATQLPAICRALADRLDRVRERGYWTAAEVASLRKQMQGQGEDLSAIRDAQCEPDCTVKIDPSEPVAVTGAGEQYGAEIVSAIQTGNEGVGGALWFLIGITVVSPIATILWMTFKRGTD